MLGRIAFPLKFTVVSNFDKVHVNENETARGLITSVMYMCIDRLVKSQCIKVPSAGIMCGYRFVFCASLSLAEKGGPGKERGDLFSLAG